MPDLLADAADRLEESLPAHGLTPAARALADLRAAAGRFTTRADALTPADACPDNNVPTPDGLVLLDFEQACVRHVAWDAAYLVALWPSRWACRPCCRRVVPRGRARRGEAVGRPARPGPASRHPSPDAPGDPAPLGRTGLPLNRVLATEVDPAVGDVPGERV